MIEIAHKDFKATIIDISKTIRENIYTKKGEVLAEFKVRKKKAFSVLASVIPAQGISSKHQALIYFH